MAMACVLRGVRLAEFRSTYLKAMSFAKCHKLKSERISLKEGTTNAVFH